MCALSSSSPVEQQSLHHLQSGTACVFRVKRCSHTDKVLHPDAVRGWASVNGIPGVRWCKTDDLTPMTAAVSGCKAWEVSYKLGSLKPTGEG